jgi:hypothetical protein
MVMKRSGGISGGIVQRDAWRFSCYVAPVILSEAKDL